jgi:hypothetical protein
MRSLACINGLLKGMGREVPCVMLAIKEVSSEAGPPVFSRCSVIETAEDLPDGTYTLAFEGYVVSARKEGGLWIPEDAIVAEPMEERSAESHQTSRNDEVIEITSFRKHHVA